jgi:hypothetical protein
MKKITINKSTVELETVDGAFFLNGQKTEHNLVKNPDGSFHLIIGDQSFDIDIVNTDVSKHSVQLLVNGRPL